MRTDTAEKMISIKFSIKDFFSKFGQIHRKLLIWSHLLEKSIMEHFIFCAVKYYLQVYLYNCAYTIIDTQLTDYPDDNLFESDKN